MARPPSLDIAAEKSLVNRYCRGESTHRLSVDFKVSVQSVCNILRRNRVTIRPRGKPARKQVQGTPTSYQLVVTTKEVVEALCAEHHAYGSAGKIFTHCFAVVEDGVAVAAFAWQLPTLGTARSVCPEAPQGVLALSRMVAVPKSERVLRHISKPLRYQMRHLIDRTRWPVLVTYSDEGQGHTGHVYKCSGWQPVQRTSRPFYADSRGVRFSAYYGGERREVKPSGTTVLQRWEHWACEKGDAAKWMEAGGWDRVPVPNRTWRSGNPAFTWVRRRQHQFANSHPKTR